jgi:hypothetical protein
VHTALQYTAAARIAVFRTFMGHDIVRSTLGDCLGEKSIQRSGDPRKASSYMRS